jgi:hypothetical protein
MYADYPTYMVIMQEIWVKIYDLASSVRTK